MQPTASLNRENYAAFDGLRSYAAIGIVLMHVYYNFYHNLSHGLLTSTIMPWLSDLTLLFMVVSAFSMCCGYYDRIKMGAITPAQFYSKRYHRIWPFFALMVVIDIMLEPSLSTFYQAFADLTLCFNLLHNPAIEVIGVGWFVGIIFTFYMLFPFFVFLIENKRKAWCTLALSMAFAFIAIQAFNGEKQQFINANIINVAPFFVAGGLVWLYRLPLKAFVQRWHYAVLLVCIALTTIQFMIPFGSLWFVLMELIVFTAWVIYALGSRDVVLNNRVVKYLSGISMEVYLCHMMCFRIVERIIHLERFIGNEDVRYWLSFALTLAGAIVFAHVVKYKIFRRTPLREVLKIIIGKISRLFSR